jgi:hypothetical protein
MPDRFSFWKIAWLESVQDIVDDDRANAQYRDGHD